MPAGRQRFSDLEMLVGMEDERVARSRAGSCVEFHSVKKMKTLAQRRQSAPSLVISKALTRSRSTSRESCLSPVQPESCPLVQAFLAECPRRLFLGHAQTQLKTGLQTQDRHLFLFSDALLVAKAKSPTHFKVKAQVRVCEMWTAGCLDEVCEGTTSPERSFVIGWPTCNCVATFSSEEHKEKWLALIKSRIIAGKGKDEPKTIPLKIFAKDIGNCAYAKTLAVSNGDSTADVIRVALLQFGISGCVKDHRLWVSSSKDEPPYPLIGHEFPFSIKMSHIRDGGSSGGGGPGGGGGGGGGGPWRDPASPTDCPEVLLLDQCLPPDTQCQFILKPSKVAPGQAPLLEPGQQKSFRRKRSLINWPFWKGSSWQLDGPPLSPSSLSPTLLSPILLSPTQGRLFGRPLSSLCSPDLPKPVMDMLVFLYLEGPYTRGVFRRSAGAKACRELRDRLDHRDEDPEIAHQSVFVIAAVLKDFLRNIPGGLLSADLYEQWMEAMGGGEEDERTQAVQRLLRLLPPDNLLLLRHVIAVLHRIQGNAQDNQMNAFNLSVCIAPSMLWAPAPGTPEMEGEDTKKVCELVRLLIENCGGVLGEDVALLLRSSNQKSGGSDHGSDVSSFQMNDSSYDSLENELNDDPESPFQETPPLRDKDKPDSRSRDSVITLSDCDADPDPDGDLLLRLPPLARPRGSNPAARQPPPPPARQGGPRRLRRSSEPALALASPLASGTAAAHADGARPLARKASYDAAMEGEPEGGEYEEFLEQRLSGLQLKEEAEEEEDGGEMGGAKVQNGGRWKVKHGPPLRLDASCSSLSSPATSPTGSSLSSLDSAFSQYSTDYGANGALSLAEPASLSPLFLGRPHVSPRDSPPQREAPPHWPPPPQVQRTCQPPSHPPSLHPNTWIKKDRRLSLRQCDEDLPESNGRMHVGGPGPQDAAAVAAASRRRSSSPPSYQQALLQLHGRSPFYRGGEKPLTIRELQQAATHGPPSPASHTGSGVRRECARPPQGVFFGQNATALVLQRQRSPSMTPPAEGHNWRRTLPRRASEPSEVTATSDLSRSLTLGRARPARGGPRPRGSAGEPDRGEASLCLSPAATRAVRDYFSSQDADSCLQRSQEVALAIVQGKREWQSRRCSDPRVDDFEQLFFAEESYV
ncbi:rho GTPase-activating protein 20 isoform X2 [Gasterosteus aculeatus]